MSLSGFVVALEQENRQLSEAVNRLRAENENLRNIMLSKVYATQQSSLCESKQSATARVQQGRQSAGRVPLGQEKESDSQASSSACTPVTTARRKSAGESGSAETEASQACATWPQSETECSDDADVEYYFTGRG
jgi:hypothetical protein